MRQPDVSINVPTLVREGALAAPTDAAEHRISIIIPAWNAAATLARCLDSLLTQQFAGTEIIVVDDGSTDDTLAIAERYARHASLRIIRQRNQGVSVARNSGLEVARGRYVMFMDADDHLAPRALQQRWQAAEAANADVLLDNAWWHAPGHSTLPLLPARMSAWAGSGRDWLVQRQPDGQLKHYVWLQFIRRDFLRGTGLRFVAGISHQDIIWTNALLWRAARVAYSPHLSYHYHLIAGSLSHPRNSARRFAAATHYLRVTEELVRLAAGTRDEDLKRIFAAQVVQEGIAALQIARRLEPAHRTQLFGLMQRSGHVQRLLDHAAHLKQRWRILRRATRYLVWWGGEALAGSLGKPASKAGRALPAVTKLGGD